MKYIIKFLSTGFLSGYAPVAPGTFGSIAAFLLLYFIAPFDITGGEYAPLYFLGMVIISIPICYEAEKIYGNDNKKIVLDEIAGYYAAVLLLPKTLAIYLIALVLFRIFDIFKPFPINKMEKVKYGFGVVLDDLAAGLISNIIIRIAIFYNIL